MVVNIFSTVRVTLAWLVINYPVDYNHTLHWDRLCDDYYNSLVIATSALLLHIYTIICLKSVCLATFAQCSSQFWLNRVGRCLKLIASTRGTFCHEFASQFGLDFFYMPKNRKPLSPAYFDPRCGDKQRNWKRQNRGNSVV